MEKIFARIREFNLVPYLIIFYTVGVVGMVLPATRELFKLLVPLNLLMNIALLFIYHGKIGTRFILSAGVIFLAGIAVEVLGVNTGIVFGSYEYGATLGPKIIHTPVMIGVNWLMLVYASLVIVSKYIETPYFRAIVAAALMVVYDFALEPSAIALDMWNWGGPVPLQNYIAWGVIAFLLNAFAERTQLVNRENKIAAPLFFVQMVFFILIDISLLIEPLWDFSSL